MNDLLPFIVVGLVSGSLYGLAGTGLTLTFRTSGVFNLAHGAVGAAAAYFFYDLHVDRGWPWPLALVAVTAMWGAVAGVVLERITRELIEASVATIVMVTVGVMLGTQGFLYLYYGARLQPLPEFLSVRSVEIVGVGVTYGQITILVGTVALIGALYAFLSFTRTGLSLRAVVESPELVGLVGRNPAAIRRISWVIGSSFAALSGILLAPSIGVDATLLTLLVIQAFGAVAIGRFSSLPATFVGGLVVGVAVAVATKYTTSQAWLRPLPNAVPFLALFSVLVVTPARHLPTALGRLRGAKSTLWRGVPASLRWSVGAVGAVALLAVPSFAGFRLPVYTNALNMVVVFASLALLVNVSGQLSLSHAAFAALGATTFSHLSGGGVPWLVAVVLAGAVVVPVGAVLALPAIRLAGIYLALATFGFAFLMHKVVYTTFLMFGGSGAFVTGSRPKFWFIDGTDGETFYFLALGIVAVCGLVMAGVAKTRIGRLLRAMAESPVALATNGCGVNVTKIIVFCISGFFAGIGGALIIANTGTARADTGFTPFDSLLWLVVLAIGGSGGVVMPAVVAAAFFVVAPSHVTSLSAEWQSALFGVAAVAVAVVFRGRSRQRRPVFDRLAAHSDIRWERSPLRRPGGTREEVGVS